jgi:hypothetical protein
LYVDLHLYYLHGVRLHAEVEVAKKKRHVIKADPAIIKCFGDMFLLLKSGALVGGVPCSFDVTSDDGAFELDITGGHEMGLQRPRTQRRRTIKLRHSYIHKLLVISFVLAAES